MTPPPALRQLSIDTIGTLIQIRTVIGFGSPRAGTSKAHGGALGEDGVAETKEGLGVSALHRAGRGARPHGRH